MNKSSFICFTSCSHLLYLSITIGFYPLIHNTFSLQWFIQNEFNIQQGKSTTHPLGLVDSTQQLQALALQQAVWGISCLVLLPPSCNDSSLHPPFSNNSSSHCCDLTIIVDSTHEHFCKTPGMSNVDVLSHWNKAWQGLNLTLHKIKLSRMKNVGAASYKKWLNWPDLPYSSDVDGKQLCEKIINCKMLVSSRAT